ncbi:hypothetical protein Tco_0359407 [Tanacetum coccineum]
MTTLKFADTHNLVAFLEKPTESAGFEKIVDILNVHPIKYALTVNPTIYTSCIKQLWSTVKAKTNNGEVQLQALVDGKKIIVTEASVRQLARMGYEKISQRLTFYKAFFSSQWKFLIITILQCLSAKTTAWNEFSSTMASAIIYLATNQKFNFSKYIFESMVKNLDNENKFLMYPSGPTFNVADEAINEENVSKHSNDPLLSGKDSLQLKELMELCTNLQNRVLALETTKTSQPHKITSLKRRVKKLEKKKRSRTYKLKRLYKVGLSVRVESSEDEGLDDQEDASKQGRKIYDIDADEDITLENVHDAEITADPVTTAGEVVTTASIEVSPASPTELTLAQTLIKIKSAKPKVKGVVIEEQIESTTRTRPQQLPSKDKAKKEEVRLAREKTKKEKEANVALIEERNDIQAKIKADQLLAERLQA